VTDYTKDAVTAVLHAARTEGDFAGWLAQVLARVAGQLGSSDALTAGRPGSWEADHVNQLVKGTVGYADEYLPGPILRLTDEKARQIKEDAYWDGRTQREIASEYGVSPSTVSDIANERTWAWIEIK
jgi:Sigma-70, region 4